MLPERLKNIVADSGCSRRPEDEVVQQLGVMLVPLELAFFENGKWVAYSDYDITLADFYRRMAQSEKLPTTSAPRQGRFTQVYEELAPGPIISIHLGSRFSRTYDSALLAAQQVREKSPLSIEVIDSGHVSLPTWWLAEKAAHLARQGVSLSEIREAVLADIPKLNLLIALETLENAAKGGRVPPVLGYIGTLIQLKPLLAVINGEITDVGRVRTTQRARKELVRRVSAEKKEVVRMGVVHANAPLAAQEVRGALQEFYPHPIDICDVPPALAVHGGPGAVAVAWQTV